METTQLHKQTPMRCRLCYREFKARDAHTRHMRRCTLAGKVRCDQCGVYFGERSVRQHKWLTCPARDATIKCLTQPESPKAQHTAQEPGAAEENAEASLLATLSSDVQKTIDLHAGIGLEMQIAADEAALLKTEVADLKTELASATSELWVHRAWLKKAFRELREMRLIMAAHKKTAPCGAVPS
jgi:hypothetical protein